MASQHEVDEVVGQQEVDEVVMGDAEEQQPLPMRAPEASFENRAEDLLGEMRRLKEEMQRGAAVNWMRQCSKHLSHIEGRLMEEAYLGHEVVRQVCMCLEQFCPEPFGQWGWFLRKVTDIGVKTVRQLVKVYGVHEADLPNFLLQANKLMRLYIEEAFHRCLLATEVPRRRRALSGLMVTLRNLESATLTEDLRGMSIFCTFTVPNVRALGLRVQAKQLTSINEMPSYAEVMRSPILRQEVFSLLVVRKPEGFLMMAKDEVQELLEANGCTVDEETVLPGRREGSIFLEVFPDAAV